MASGSAGTLNVTIAAQTGPLASGMKQGEDYVRRFRRTVDGEAEGVARASARMSRGFDVSAGQMAKSFRAGVAGLALLSQATDGVAGDFTRLAGNIATGFAVGGPAGGAIAAVSEGFSFIANRIRSGREEAAKFRAELERMQAAKVLRDAEAAVARARAMGQQDEDNRKFMLGQARAGKRAGMSAAEAAKFDRESEVADVLAARGGASAQTVRDRQAAEAAAEARRDRSAVQEREAERRRLAEEAINRNLGDRERLLRIEGRLSADQVQWARDYMEIQDLIAAGRTKDAERLKTIVLLEQGRAKAAKDAEAEKDRKRAISESNQEIARQIRDLSARNDLERMANRHADDLDRMKKAGLPTDNLLKKNAYEIALYKHDQAVAASAAAAATQRQAEAERQAAHAAKNRADAEKEAASAAARAQQMNTFGAGYGPLAQARDAKRRNSNIARFKNHQANLDAEARARPSAGNGQPWQVGAPQFDADGNPIGVADPFAFDLGSIFDRQKKPKPRYDFAAPGLLAPAYVPAAPAPPAIPGMAPPATSGPGAGPVLTASEPALSAAGDAVKAGGEAATDAATKVTAAAEKMSTGADEIAQGSGEIADQLGAAADSVGRAAEAIAGIDEAMSGFNDRLATLEAALAAASFFGG